MVKAVPQSMRIGLLAVTLAGALLVLGKAIATPKDSNAAKNPYQLPSAVPLSGWQASGSSNLQKAKGDPTGQNYTYTQGQNSVEVRLLYMKEDGNVSRFLFVYSPVRAANANLQMRYQPGVGYYGVLSHEGKAYLSACIAPRGESTVTEQQFRENLYAHDLQVGRILPWISGQEPLLDRRCLWTLMSTPLPSGKGSDPQASETAYKALESAWFSWFQWWQPKFPPA